MWKISNVRLKLLWFFVCLKLINDDKVCSFGGVKCDMLILYKCSVLLVLIWKELLLISIILLLWFIIKLFWFMLFMMCLCLWIVVKDEVILCVI